MTLRSHPLLVLKRETAVLSSLDLRGVVADVYLGGRRLLEGEGDGGKGKEGEERRRWLMMMRRRSRREFGTSVLEPPR